MRIKGMKDHEMGELYRLPAKGMGVGNYYYVNGPYDKHGVVVSKPDSRGVAFVRGTFNMDLRGKYGIR
jgi:hypothetical protein